MSEHGHAPDLAQTLPVYLALPVLFMLRQGPTDVIDWQPPALFVLLIQGGRDAEG